MDIEKYDMPDSAWMECKRNIDGDMGIEFDLPKFERDMYYILIEKTEGEAMIRVNAAKEGMGLHAYQRLYCWFAGATGLALQERMRAVMGPASVRKDEDLSDAIEK